MWKLGGRTILAIVAFALIGATVGYSAINSMIPVNGKFPVLAAPENTYLVAKHDPQAGYVFATKGTSGKKSLGAVHIAPEIHVGKNQLDAIHFISDDTDSKHNLNIDEFNVHTRDLSYFETQTIMFQADKTGTFKYYCSLHPEMNGRLIVE